MAKIIKNMGDFAKIFTPKVKETLMLVAEDVKKEIDEALDRYYEEYDPEDFDIFSRKSLTGWYYHRTEQLRNCCVISEPKIHGNTITIEIYLDINSLQYDTIGADAYKTVVAANAGLHGGFDVESMEQIPWGYISSNTGVSYGNGTQIWEEPMQELFTTNKIVELFKKYANQRGLNIK